MKQQLQMTLKMVEMKDGGFELTFLQEDLDLEVSMMLSPLKFDGESKVQDVKTEEKYKRLLEEYFDNDPESCIDKEYTIYINTSSKGKMYANLEDNSFTSVDKAKDTDLKKNKTYDCKIVDVEFDDKGIKMILQSDTLLLKETKEPALIGKTVYYKDFNRATNTWGKENILKKGTFVNDVKKKLNIDIVAILDGQEVDHKGLDFQQLAKASFKLKDESIIGTTIKCIGAQAGANLYLEVIEDLKRWGA